tara:strand:+ start:1227 stop:1373 length:147 start_codon:yes stop_codon:yes gene_type:complete
MNDTMLMEKNMKYVFDLMLSMATGKYWPTAMEPIAPALADILMPFART